MKCLVCFLEEPSAGEMLKGVLPRILGDEVEIIYMVFEGKQDLEKRLAMRMRYWQRPNSSFLVLRDQDSGDCIAIKTGLQNIVTQSGKNEMSIVRIACHELETFYLGDLQAVEKGLELKGLAKKQVNRKYRNPDNLSNPSQELGMISNKKYQKVAGSRSIGPHLKIDGSNKSLSFNVLLEGVKKILDLPETI